MTEINEMLADVRKMIDEALDEIAHTNIVETSVMTDLLLDLRLLLITEGEKNNV